MHSVLLCRPERERAPDPQSLSADDQGLSPTPTPHNRDAFPGLIGQRRTSCCQRTSIRGGDEFVRFGMVRRVLCLKGSPTHCCKAAIPQVPLAGISVPPSTSSAGPLSVDGPLRS